MATELDYSGGGSKKRRTDEEGEQAADEDRVSALPDALRLHILGLLPLKSAIRTGALSTQWRALWTCRWPAPASLDFRLAPHDSPWPLLESLERRGRRRLDRFSISFQADQLKTVDLNPCLNYAAACAVADLDVHRFNADKSSTRVLNFILPSGANDLARLSLTGIHVGHSCFYPVLEVIHLHRVTIHVDTLFNLVAQCPLLRTIDIRYCELRCVYLTAATARANLKNVTIVESECVTGVFIGKLSSLRSFRYSGAYLPADIMPDNNSAIHDLYICFGGPACRLLRYDEHGRPCKMRGCWLDRLISVSNLTALTLCSSALRRVSAKARARSISGNAALCKLQNLREMQLLMFAMYNDNFLDDIMAFLMTCCTPRLERLFVTKRTSCPGDILNHPFFLFLFRFGALSKDDIKAEVPEKDEYRVSM